jgi:carbon-monoxide dehydrogenase medium subunit
MHDFDYHRPATLAEALQHLVGDDEAKPLAGGQTLLASLKLRLARPSRLVDLGRLAALRGLRTDAGGRVTIGAMTAHAEVADSAALREVLPALPDLAAQIGDPMVRQMGTIGGSLANSDPAADWPAAVLGLEATVVTDRRRIGAADFFTGLFQTALEPGELITEVEFPRPRRAAYAKLRHPASRFALVGVFVADTAAGPRVAVTGAGACVFRLPAFEQALARRFDPAALAGLAVEPTDLNSDLHAGADYRAHLVGVMARRAVAAVVAS